MRATRTNTSVILEIFLIVLSCQLPGTAVSADRPPLLLALGARAADVSLDAAVDEYHIEINFEALRLPAADFDVELPGGVLRSVRKTIHRQHGDRSFSWIGQLDTSPTGEASRADVILAVRGDALSGLLLTDDGLYQIVPRPGGQHRLARIDSTRYPDCAGGIPAPLEELRRPLEPSAALPLEPPHRIDVMVVYTPQAKAEAGGVSQVEASIQAALDVANTAFDNSQVITKLFLTHTEEVGYLESGILANDLDWVSTDAGVAALRDLHKADLVALVVTAGDSCGTAFVQSRPDPSFESFAFQVTVLSCAVGNMTLAHELAHLQGAEHNPEDSVRGAGLASFPWAFGHYHDGSYRTLMSLDSPCSAQCPRRPYVSNSNVLVDGLPIGVLDERENYRVLNDTAGIVANFRQRPPVIFIDGFEAGHTGAWSCVTPSCEE